MVKEKRRQRLTSDQKADQCGGDDTSYRPTNNIDQSIRCAAPRCEQCQYNRIPDPAQPGVFKQCRNTSCVGKYCWQHRKKKDNLKVARSDFDGNALGKYGKGLWVLYNPNLRNDGGYEEGEVITQYKGLRKTHEEMKDIYGRGVTAEYGLCFQGENRGRNKNKVKKPCVDARRSNEADGRWAQRKHNKDGWRRRLPQANAKYVPRTVNHTRTFDIVATRDIFPTAEKRQIEIIVKYDEKFDTPQEEDAGESEEDSEKDATTSKATDGSQGSNRKRKKRSEDRVDEMADEMADYEAAGGDGEFELEEKRDEEDAGGDGDGSQPAKKRQRLTLGMSAAEMEKLMRKDGDVDRFDSIKLRRDRGKPPIFPAQDSATTLKAREDRQKQLRYPGKDPTTKKYLGSGPGAYKVKPTNGEKVMKVISEQDRAQNEFNLRRMKAQKYRKAQFKKTKEGKQLLRDRVVKTRAAKRRAAKEADKPLLKKVQNTLLINKYKTGERFDFREALEKDTVPAISGNGLGYGDYDPNRIRFPSGHLVGALKEQVISLSGENKIRMYSHFYKLSPVTSTPKFAPLLPTTADFRAMFPANTAEARELIIKSLDRIISGRTLAEVQEYVKKLDPDVESYNDQLNQEAVVASMKQPSSVAPNIVGSSTAVPSLVADLHVPTLGKKKE